MSDSTASPNTPSTVQHDELARKKGYPGYTSYTEAAALVEGLDRWLERTGLLHVGLGKDRQVRVRALNAGLTDEVMDRYATMVTVRSESNLVTKLQALASEGFPDLPVASALGYAFVSEHDTLVDRGHTGKVVLMARSWRRLGLEVDGWLLEAAGLTRHDLGSVSIPNQPVLVAMAQIRGVVLPHA